MMGMSEEERMNGKNVINPSDRSGKRYKGAC